MARPRIPNTNIVKYSHKQALEQMTCVNS
jgi:hypothetical protein